MRGMALNSELKKAVTVQRVESAPQVAGTLSHSLNLLWTENGIITDPPRSHEDLTSLRRTDNVQNIE